MIKKRKIQSGQVLLWVLGFITTISIILTSTFSVITLTLSESISVNKNQLALNIADAGVNYYLWHLSHSSADFKDGNTSATPNTSGEFTGFYGPFVHQYKDDNSKNVGTYTLYIKPKSEGSSVAIVRSIGKTNDEKIQRTIEAEIGAPSFASFSLAGDVALWFGNNESANGPVHSNVGVRMDGQNTDDVTSANATYVPPSNLGGNGSTSRPGVWCSTTVTTPVNCNTRPKGLWRYPVPSIDFNAITSDLCTIKKNALLVNSTNSAIANGANACTNTSGVRTSSYIPRYATAFNARRGYLIELNSNNTYNLSSVTNETYNYSNSNNYTSSYTAALSRTAIASNIAIPSNGVIFVEDNVWVRSNPTFKGRVTIASGRLASSSEQTSIVIADDIKYSTKDGSDALGMIAEQDVVIAPYAPPKPNDSESAYPFEINGALIAKDGHVWFPPDYIGKDTPNWNGNSNKKLLYYGSISTRQSWTWLWTSGSSYDDGFQYNETNFDYNLLYAPPPSFPITSTYDILKWREILVTP
ncbi:hypothetical protein KBC85_00255 [Candidatus Saccharibacteria bacterium]|nr:hypothetical protein [Candidatus Saccharibacteria bacterium]MDQ5958830.1 hypothetical protein [Patescibacteria group bacterium]